MRLQTKLLFFSVIQRWMRKNFCRNVFTANVSDHNKCESVVGAVKGDVLLIDNEIKRSLNSFGLWSPLRKVFCNFCDVDLCFVARNLM